MMPFDHIFDLIINEDKFLYIFMKIYIIKLP